MSRKTSMPRDLITHNRVARLAADSTPAAFVCLVTFDPELDEVSVESISGTGTPLFAQVNASARRAESGWDPSISALATANDALTTLFHDRRMFQGEVHEFLESVIEESIMDSTFAQFKNHWCLGMPITVYDEVYAALLFVAPRKYTKSQEDTCRDFVDQCQTSVFSLMEEQRITQEIDQLINERRNVRTSDPLGLTQRSKDTLSHPRVFEDISLSHETQTAARGKRELNLTRREFELLDTFLQSPGTALSRVQIVSRVWVERDGISSNVLNVTVKNLREKLEADGEARVIHSLRAYGYVLKV
jgi:DNA-binding CsgD family transcriptional regulator